ncbi:MAG: hypothetical protein JXB62_14040 [Pirellulales bacterium]|nr:hypothetical protein [Pirellulales bacterium]
MAYLEQAVFTSAETSRSAGYQVVARSPGICEADARDLSIWGPSHDSMLELGPDAASINFFPLSSGSFCVSRTTPAGWEYSGRGGYRIYTHCLVVPPEVLGRFANNPFAVVRAAQASGWLEVPESIPHRLEPVHMAGGAASVDQTLLVRLAGNPGASQVAALVQAALDSPRVAVAGKPSAGELIAGLFSCLPIECRREFSFSTGLKFSSRRPFRIISLSGDRTEQRWIANQDNITVLHLGDGPPDEALPRDGWGRLIERVLASGRTSFLATQLSKRRFHLSLDDLSALGLQFLEELDASSLRKDHAQQGDSDAAHAVGSGGDDSCEEQDVEDSGVAGPDSAELPDVQHAHAAHHRFESTGANASVSKVKTIGPARTLDPNSPSVLEKLELLDDLVYEAVGGQTAALVQLKQLWPEVLAELGEQLVAESREQYLRYALLIWEESVDHGSIRDPARAVQALDVLCVLFDEPQAVSDD